MQLCILLRVQIFEAHNFRGFRGFAAIRENWAREIILYTHLLSDFHENGSPRKLHAAKNLDVYGNSQLVAKP